MLCQWRAQGSVTKVLRQMPYSGLCYQPVGEGNRHPVHTRLATPVHSSHRTALLLSAATRTSSSAEQQVGSRDTPVAARLTVHAICRYKCRLQGLWKAPGSTQQDGASSNDLCGSALLLCHSFTGTITQSILLGKRALGRLR
jgi:hypothetical protein